MTESEQNASLDEMGNLSIALPPDAPQSGLFLMSLSDSRECVWCNEVVRVRKDGRLAVHKWDVGWDRERDVPVKGRCVGSGTSEADAEEAQR